MLVMMLLSMSMLSSMFMRLIMLVDMIVFMVVSVLVVMNMIIWMVMAVTMWFFMFMMMFVTFKMIMLMNMMVTVLVRIRISNLEGVLIFLIICLLLDGFFRLVEGFLFPWWLDFIRWWFTDRFLFRFYSILAFWCLRFYIFRFSNPFGISCFFTLLSLCTLLFFSFWCDRFRRWRCLCFL